MKNPLKKPTSEVEGLFQQITGSYYLIPNIKKCLKRILETVNSELSLLASIIYYEAIKEKKIIVKNYLNGDKDFLNRRIYELSEIIFKENYPNINNTKRVSFDKDIEACIIPIRWELNLLGIMILFANSGSLSQDNIIEDSIGAYVTAACIGNHLIISKESTLNTHFGLRVNQEISVKKLLEWRIQEIVNSFFDQLLPKQNIFQEISRETERILIIAALKGTDNNQSKAAKYLGINRNTLRKKIRELNLDGFVKSQICSL